MPSAEMQDNPYKFDGDMEESPFPVETSRRRSYHSQASVVWVKGSGLQVRQKSRKNVLFFSTISPSDTKRTTIYFIGYLGRYSETDEICQKITRKDESVLQGV